MPIRFLYSQSCELKVPNELKAKHWIDCILKERNINFDLTYKFISPDEMVEYNRFYLDHDYVTDIISFENSFEFGTLSASFYVCLDFIREDSENHKLQYKIDVYRVLLHGILHFLGFNDDTEDNTKLMQEEEDRFLSLLFSPFSK